MGVFNTGKKVTYDKTSTIIGEGVVIEGATLKATDSVRIDGKFIGDLVVDGNVVIGESGVVVGNIASYSSLISGKINGDIKCTESVHLTSTANINGNIETESLITDDGSTFNGNCRMSRNPNVISNEKA